MNLYYNYIYRYIKNYHDDMVSLRQHVFLYLKNNPRSKTTDLREKFKDVKWNSVRTYRNQFWKEQEKPDILDIKKLKKSNNKNPSKGCNNMAALIESNLIRILQMGTDDARILNTGMTYLDKTNQFIV